MAGTGDSDTDTGAPEGGDLDWSLFSLSCLVLGQSSTECTALVRLTIPTDTGATTIATLDTVPATPSGLGSLITSVMSDMDSILSDTGSKGDDE